MNPTIATGEVTELSDPWVRKIAQRVVKEMELALEKTVANAADPAAYPLPRQADAAERILQSRLARLRPEQRALAVSRVIPASGRGRPSARGPTATCPGSTCGPPSRWRSR